MIKSSNYFTLAWEITIILLITTLLSLLSFVLLKNLINNSNFFRLIYFYIPSLIAISYTIYNKGTWVGFFLFKIELINWYRYFLFLAIVTGFVFISISFASAIKISTVLLIIDRINVITNNFSLPFYIKMVILSPAIEEFIFRGIILGGFLTRYSPPKAIVLSSLFFAIFHFNLMQFLITFLLGLLCGWYYVKTRNLLSCVIIHSLNNLIGLIVIKYFIDKLSQQIITSNSSLFPIDSLFLVLIFSLILILLGLYGLIFSVVRSQVGNL
jgi:membrane protease YdiL (CAAX protease family)